VRRAPLGRGLGSIGAAVPAAALYFGLVFAAGFGLGTIRILLIAPRLGEVGAVLLETPIILWVSWAACGFSVRMFKVQGRAAEFVMGAEALVLLMVAELPLSLLVFRRPLARYLQAYATPAGAIGLCGQLVFGLLPLVRAGRLARAPSAPP